MSAPFARARCIHCRTANAMRPGSACMRHAAVAQPSLSQREIASMLRDESPGIIGPVPVHAFAYVAGTVPTFDERTGKRIM